MKKTLFLLVILILNYTDILAQRTCSNDGLTSNFLTTENYSNIRGGCYRNVVLGFRYRKTNPIIAASTSFKINLYGDGQLIETKTIPENSAIEHYRVNFPFYIDFTFYTVSIQRIDKQILYFGGHPNPRYFYYPECHNFGFLNVSSRPGYTGIGCWDYSSNSGGAPILALSERTSEYAYNVSIYTLGGKLISSRTFSTKEEEEEYLNNIPKGRYIIKNNNDKSFRKVAK